MNQAVRNSFRRISTHGRVHNSVRRPAIRPLDGRRRPIQIRSKSDDKGPDASQTDLDQVVPLAGYYAEILGQSMQKLQIERPQSITNSNATITEKPKQGLVIKSQEAAPPTDTTQTTTKLVAGAAIPPKPSPPDPESCCMSGCVNCVWDIYREELEEWAAKSAGANARLEGRHASAQELDADVLKAAGSQDGEASAGTKVKDAIDNVPVGMSEFMKMEKMLKERKQERSR